MTGTIYDNKARIVAIINPQTYTPTCSLCGNKVCGNEYNEIKIEDNMIYSNKYLCYKCRDFLRDWLVANG